MFSKSILKTIALSHWPIWSKFGTVADIPTICVLVASFIDDTDDDFGDIFGDGFADRSVAASNNLVQINSKRNPRWPSPTKWISSMTTIPSSSFFIVQDYLVIYTNINHMKYGIRYNVYHIRCKTYYTISLLLYTLLYYNIKFILIMWIMGPNATQNHMRITISTTY